MRLQLTRRSDYAIRACLLLAMNEDGTPVSSRRIAERMAIPDRFLPQVLADLGRAGVVTATNGKHGGYRLNRDPIGLSLLELIETVEGPSRAENCVLEQRPCDGGAACALHPVWASAQTAFTRVLATTSLAAIVDRQRASDGSGCALPRERMEP